MRLALILATAAIAAPALAQDRPPIRPTRDVSVTYRTTGMEAMGNGETRMSWSVAGQQMRMDMGAQGGWLVIDTRANRAFMVMDAQRMVMQLPQPDASATRGMMLAESARFTREGNDRIAGQACTNWRIETEGNATRACITSEGVMLRNVMQVQGRDMTTEATAVEFGTQDPARFRPPAGYQSMQMPGMGGGMPPGMGGGRPPGK